MTNDDRLSRYYAAVAAYRLADPHDFAYRFRRGLLLLALPFPWGQVARGNVVAIRRRK